MSYECLTVVNRLGKEKVRNYMNEHRLLSHLNMKDTSNLSKMYVGNYKYGEIKKLFYLNLYNAVTNGIEQVRVTVDRIEFYKAGSLDGYSQIALFQSRTNTTFLEQFSQILEIDQALMQSIHIAEKNEDSITIEIQW